MRVSVCFFVIFVALCLGDRIKAAEPQCSTACPDIYKPVCCTYANGTTATYGNSCEAVAYNCPRNDCCVTTEEGECSEQTEPAQCPQVACTMQYDPICCYYADGTTRTFGNSCEASVINCQERKCCVSTTLGECKSTA
ncbi:U-Kazal-Dg21.2-like [Phlebotomus papatasi]|uniref:U-Kazal-Dg21.2-like n=1 Tax=Phlebotomus papatasi TaxID=29031 RepID=UPI0024845EED|nr:U-Kazal-Dg21.2-like [Phlebotomus papatasi]